MKKTFGKDKKSTKSSFRFSKNITKRLLTLLAFAVVFATSYSLILPAITADQSAATRENGFFLGKESWADAAEGIALSSTSSISMPAQEFYSDAEWLKDYTVKVEAPEGALPDGTTMTIRPAADEKNTEDLQWLDIFADGIQKHILDVKNPDGTPASEQALAAADQRIADRLSAYQGQTVLRNMNGTFAAIRAFAIQFTDANGNEICPAKSVQVTLTCADIAKEQLLVTEESRPEEITNSNQNIAIFHPALVMQEGQQIYQAFPAKEAAFDAKKQEITFQTEDLAAGENQTDVSEMNTEQETCLYFALVTTETPKTDSTNSFANSIVSSNPAGDSNSAETQGTSEASSANENKLYTEGKDCSVSLYYNDAANIPADSTIRVKEVRQGSYQYRRYLSNAKEAVQNDAQSEDSASTEEKEPEISFARFYDISVISPDGKEIEPSAPVRVEIAYDEEIETVEGASFKAVHFAKGDTEVISADLDEDGDQGATVSFEAERFSVYGVVYTVDFEYSVNGKMYQFSLPGGGFVSFTDLIEVLGIIGDTNSGENGDENGSVISKNVGRADENTAGEGSEDRDVGFDSNTALTLGDVEVSEATRKFVADVTSVDFSSPSLVNVSKVESETTVGQIKESRGLESQYSAELTEEQIAEINAQTVGAGDWALISVQPFMSEETLTVTMKDGEVFTIRVTDAQIKKTVIDAKGDTWEITVTYGEDARIPDGAELKVREILPEDEKYEQYFQQSLEKVGVTAAKTDKADDPAQKAVSDYARIFDIEIWADDHKVEPAADVAVNIKLLDPPGEAEVAPQVVHFAKDGAELIEMKERAENSEDEGIQFVTDEFSVYSVVFTVDFSYEVNGKVYGFTMQGEDSVGLRALIEALHVYGKTADEEKHDGEANEVETSISSEDLADKEAEQESAEDNQALNEFMANIVSVEFSNPELLAVCKVEEDSTLGELKYTNSIDQKFSHLNPQEEVIKRNSVEYSAGDWVLISLMPFDSKEELIITLKTGECFTITVTDAQDAVMNSDGTTVQTISNPAGTTIDLFDYWVNTDLRYNDGRSAWPGYYDGWSPNDQNLGGTGNEAGINEGHALKFSPAWEHTVINGTNGTHNTNGANGLNSYTGGINPFQGIVQSTLDEGYPKLTNNLTIGSNGETLDYLFDPDEPNEYRESYTGVNQLLYVDKDGYYTFDSQDYYARLNESEKTFTVTEQITNDSNMRGFWPLNDQSSGTRNFWMGMHVNAQFSMPASGRVLNPSGVRMPMQFEFSGDDDVWIYVDGILIGDAGGIHNRTEVDINFQTGIVSITGQQDKYLDDLFRTGLRDQGKTDAEIDQYISEQFGGHTFKTGTDHTFDFFYLERGGEQSNFYIHYNLVSTADFTAHKAYKSKKISGEDNPDDILKRNQFQFELIGYDADDGTPAIMPAGDPDGKGTVDSPQLTHNDEEGYSALIIGVSEDGNINFGNVDLTNQEMGRTFRYKVREVIPEDAEYVEGQGWVKDGVTYDDTVYYFTGEVQETTTGFKLKKTRYTDETYTTVDNDTQFNSFENMFKAEPGKLEFDKTDSFGDPVANAEFTLYTDPRCRNIAKDGDGNDLVKLSGTNGKVTFDNIPAPAVYYMKETQKPGEDYIQNDTIYEVHVFATSSGKTSVITVYGEENGEPLTAIVNSKKGELSVKKVWLDGSGNPMTGSQNVNVTLKRRKTEVPADLPTNHITFQMHISDPGWGPDYSNMTVVLEKDVLGYNAAIEWYDCWKNMASLTVTQQDGTPISTDHYSYWSIDENNHSRKLGLYGISDGAIVKVEYAPELAWLWQGDHKAKVQSPSIEAGEIQTEIVEDDDFSYAPIVLSAPDYFRVWKTGGNSSNYVADGYDLPAVDSNNRPYYYYVEEADLEGYQTTYTNNEGITEGQIKITNQAETEKSINVVIKKTDNAENSTNYLDGAVFKLMFRPDSSGTFTNVSRDIVPELNSESQFTVPTAGITLTGLVDGQYQLQEIYPPSGYVITSSTPVTFIVSGGTITSTEGTITGVRYAAATETSDAEFIVPNEPGAALPNTGGPGTRIFTILGGILIAFAGVLLWRRQRTI